jgi:hypothetical protein
MIDSYSGLLREKNLKAAESHTRRRRNVTTSNDATTQRNDRTAERWLDSSKDTCRLASLHDIYQL